MTRKTRSRQKPRRPRRRARARSVSPAIAGAARSGWGRFAFGIVIGLGFGLAAVLYSDLLAFDRPGSADKVIASTSPESQYPSAGARVTIELPNVEEPTKEAAAPQPVQRELAVAEPEQATASEPVATAEVVVEKTTQSASVEPAGMVGSGGVDTYESGGSADPTWLRNAVAFSVPRGQPVIAIVLDDVGVNRADAEQAIDLPPEVTLALMTYASNVDDLAARARAKGHELMLHVPMEPLGAAENPGPKALMVGLSDAENLARLRWGLDRFDGYIGINNHMGSRFTQDERGMRTVMEELRRRHLLFLDSRTIATHVGERLAVELGVAHVSRDVFLDDDMNGSAVARQLAVAEHVAREAGQAIAIGHPHPATIAAIKAWLPEAKARGFVIVPLSVVARRQIGVTG